jgi:hypothetical protein
MDHTARPATPCAPLLPIGAERNGDEPQRGMGVDRGGGVSRHCRPWISLRALESGSDRMSREPEVTS